MAETRGSAFAELELPLAGGLHLATYGERTVPERAVLVVHGISGNHRFLGKIALALAQAGCFAVVPDLRGRGRSARPAHGYGLPFHADDLLGVLDALELPSAHLVGHSLGALIGLYLGALFPDRVRRLVAIDAGGVVPADGLRALGHSLSRVGRTFESDAAYMDAVRAAMQPILGGWDAFWEDVYRYDIVPVEGGGVTSALPLFALQQELAANTLVRMRGIPAQISATTLVVRAGAGILGPEDGRILTREEAERLCGELARGELVDIPDVNHYSIVAAPALAREVVRFLAPGGGHPADPA